MKKIQPFVKKRDIVCAETVAPPNALIVFGASGDLAARKLFPSLAQLFMKELISPNFYIIGCGRKKMSDVEFRKVVHDAVCGEFPEMASESTFEIFISRFYYIDGDYDDGGFYKKISERVKSLDGKHNVDGSHIFYLAVPPFLYETIVKNLFLGHLSCPENVGSRPKPRIVIEKPFGRDLNSAVELNKAIRRCFDESQIYRIDHYLGKETVQNIMMFRFANTIFEPLWNRNYIDSVQITVAEKLGVEHRGSFYDQAGALRDIFQNHMLQMLSLVAMEPPSSFEADSLRDEKVKLLRAIRPFDTAAIESNIVRGQYTSGIIDGQKVCGYREEPGVNADSQTETFVAAKLFIDNLRWKDVPFYLRTGKRLARKDTEIAITFKKIPHSMFVSVGLDDLPSNVLIFQIQPEEGISLNFQAKVPGSKICMDTLSMNLNYQNVFGIDMPEAYQRLLLDCMAGDQTLFTRYDDVETAWRLLEPVMKFWRENKMGLFEYPAGSESFVQADNLVEPDGRKWRKLGEA